MATETFTMDEVHMHYCCKCSFHPECVLDTAKGEVEIPVNQRCPVCKRGKALELVIGGVCLSDTKCPEPGCTCDEITLKIPINQFIYFLKKPLES